MAVLGCRIFQNSTDQSSHMHVPKRLDQFIGHWERRGEGGRLINFVPKKGNGVVKIIP